MPQLSPAGDPSPEPPAPADPGSSARLSWYLAISHAAPVLVVALAMGLTLLALVRISVVLTTLNDSELTALRTEGRVHRQAWAVDVAMRHAYTACLTGKPTAAPVERVRSAAQGLDALLDEVAPGGPMRSLAEGYLQTAEHILGGAACERLQAPASQKRRAELDEQLTNVWVDRLEELHTAVGGKERTAKRIAVSATYVGIPLAALALLLAVFTAGRMARSVRRPLERLAQLATRIGHGNFHTPVQVHEGPAEVRSLGAALEHMRRQLLQLDTLKQGFLASVSHELRTPLSKIRESLALMEDGAVGRFETRQLRVIQIARSACERQIRLVTTLLDLSRLRAGSPVRIREMISADAVLQSAVDDEQPDATSRKVELTLQLEGPAVSFRVDPVLLERAVANLIRNAVSVSRAGQQVTVQRRGPVTRPDAPGRWLRLGVSDDGPGVPAEIRDRLFQPFVTHPIPSSGKSLGVGLGLALAREVAQAHGGELELEAPPSGGATFWMWLPVDDDGLAAQVRDARGPAPREPAGMAT